MNITLINGQLFFTKNNDSLNISDSAVNDFLQATTLLDASDVFTYCKNVQKQTLEPIRSQDILDFCKSNGELLHPSTPITNIGDFNDYISTEEPSGSLNDLLDELESKGAKCIKPMKALTDNLTTIINQTIDLYPIFITFFNETIQNKVNYYTTFLPTYSINKIKAYALISDNFNFLSNKYQKFLELDAELQEVEEQNNNMDDITRLQTELAEYVASLTPDEIEQYKNIIAEKKQEITNLSEDDNTETEEFQETPFYLNFTERINTCNEIVVIIDRIKDNSFIRIRDKKAIVELKNKCITLRDLYDYQINDYIEELNQVQQQCHGGEEDALIPTPQQFIDEVPLGSDFDITSQEITILDRAYWVKFAKLLTRLGLMIPPFWANGIYLIPSFIPVPLPTKYINLGVISIKVPMPPTGTMTPLPFLIVPFLAITGIVVTPYVLFVNISNAPIGPIAPMSAVCLYTWRSGLVNAIVNSGSEEVKPVTVTVGSVKLDVSPHITLLLSMLLKDDFPPYNRLKLTNIPFVLLSLMKYLAIQRMTVGLP